MTDMRAPISLDVWQSVQIVGASACVIFILHQKIQKMVKCTFLYQLTQVVCKIVVCVCVCVCVLLTCTLTKLYQLHYRLVIIIVG